MTCLSCCPLTNCMWLQADNKTTQRHLSVYQHHQIQDCKSKITWNQVCILARHKHWRFFFSKTLSTTWTAPACCYEILRNLRCQSSYFWWKLVGLFFLWFPGWKWKICREQSRLTFSSHNFPAQFRTHSYVAHIALCSTVSLLAGYM